MWNWLSRQVPGRVAGWAAVLVLGLWLVYFAAVISGSWYKWPDRIDRLGQSGDTFGSINALFTGLALIGLVYTVFLQRVEIEDNRRALKADRREQFLSARLNARTALLQSTAATSPSTDNIHARREWFQELRSHTVQLEILICEIHQGVDDNDWTPLVERRALRQYLIEILNMIEFHLYHRMTRNLLYLDYNISYALKADELAEDINRIRINYWESHRNIIEIIDDFTLSVQAIRRKLSEEAKQREEEQGSASMSALTEEERAVENAQRREAHCNAVLAEIVRARHSLSNTE